MPAVEPSLKPNNQSKFRNKQDEIDKIGNSQSPRNSQSQGDISATLDPSSFSTNSRMKKHDYASVAAFKLVKIPE